MSGSAAPATTGPAASGRAIWLALSVVYLAWGSTYVGIRIMDRTIPPMIGAGCRYFAAGTAMYLFLWFRRGTPPRVRPRELGSLALVGVLLLVGGNGLVCLAEAHVPAGLSSLVIASVPLWLLVFRLISRDRPSRATLGGLGFGFLGVGLLVLRGGAAQGVSVPELLVVLAAAFCWALGSWTSGKLPMPDDAATATALEMLIGGAVMMGLGPAIGESWSRAALHASANSVEALAYLSLFGSVLAFTAYVWVLQKAPISQVSTYAYVNPIVAVILGALLLNERITLTTIIGGATILVAVALVIRGEAAAKPDRAGAPDRSIERV